MRLSVTFKEAVLMIIKGELVICNNNCDFVLV